MADPATFGGQCGTWGTVCNLWSECITEVVDIIGGGARDPQEWHDPPFYEELEKYQIENEKLRLAFWGMCNQKTKRAYKVSSRDYEYAKKLCLFIWKKPKPIEQINKMKETAMRNRVIRHLKGEKINRKQDGELNHNYNKKWITNIETNESKMIKGDIPDGWKLGRVKIGSLGNPNSIGKIWYHNLNGDEKYFKKNDVIPDGWLKGRNKIKKIGILI